MLESCSDCVRLFSREKMGLSFTCLSFPFEAQKFAMRHSGGIEAENAPTKGKGNVFYAPHQISTHRKSEVVIRQQHSLETVGQ